MSSIDTRSPILSNGRLLEGVSDHDDNDGASSTATYLPPSTTSSMRRRRRTSILQPPSNNRLSRFSDNAATSSSSIDNGTYWFPQVAMFTNGIEPTSRNSTNHVDEASSSSSISPSFRPLSLSLLDNLAESEETPVGGSWYSGSSDSGRGSSSQNQRQIMNNDHQQHSQIASSASSSSSNSQNTNRSRSSRRRRLFANLHSVGSDTSATIAIASRSRNFSHNDTHQHCNTRSSSSRTNVQQPFISLPYPNLSPFDVRDSTPITIVDNSSSTSPRLELPEHSLQSFKRSFEEATAAGQGDDGHNTTGDATTEITGQETTNRAWAGDGGEIGNASLSSSFSSDSPSGSSNAFSTSNESSSNHHRGISMPTFPLDSSSFDTDNIPLTARARHESIHSSVYSRAESISRSPPIILPPLRSDLETSTSSGIILSHSPPTPESGGRVKRRRSQSADSSVSFSASSTSSTRLGDHHHRDSNDQSNDSGDFTSTASESLQYIPAISPTSSFEVGASIWTGESDHNHDDSLLLPALDLNLPSSSQILAREERTTVAHPSNIDYIGNSNDEPHNNTRSSRDTSGGPSAGDLWEMALDQIDAPFEYTEVQEEDDDENLIQASDQRPNVRLSHYIDSILARNANYSSEHSSGDNTRAPANTSERPSLTSIISAPVLSPPSAVARSVLSTSGTTTTGSSSPVSARRGLVRQFSLGTLPLFHFEEEDIEEEDSLEFGDPPVGIGSSSSTSASVTTATSAASQFSSALLPAFANRSDESSTSGSRQDRRRSTSPSFRSTSTVPRRQYIRSRRPNLQRNTTAVSPPEESPINTPEEGENDRTSDEFSIYPGMLGSSTSHRSTAALPSLRLSRDEEWQEHGWHMLTGDRAPRLSLDLGPVEGIETEERGERIDITSDNAPIVADSLRIPGTVETARAQRNQGDRAADLAVSVDVDAAASTGSSIHNESHERNFSSTFSTGNLPTWRWDAETQRAELLSDQLERGREIAAEVQNLQTRSSPTTHNSYYTDAALNTSTSVASTQAEIGSIQPRSSPYGSSGSSRAVHRPAPFARLSPSVSQPNINPLSAQGSTSRATRTGLWGEVISHPSTYRFSPQSAYSRYSTSSPAMTTAGASNTHSQPHLNRRPGALGNSNLRGPTRSSNEIWLRNQGIDFYDSMNGQAPSASNSSAISASGNMPRSSTEAAQTMQLRSQIPSFRRVTPTPVSSEPTSPELASSATLQNPPSSPVLGSDLSTHPWQTRTSDAPSNRSQSARGVSTTTSSSTRPICPERIGRPSTSADPNGHRGRSVTTDEGATARFRPLSQPERPRRLSRPQLEAIRPVSPILLRQPEPAPSPAVRRRENTLVSDPGDSPHPLSASLNGDRSPMSWLQEGANGPGVHSLPTVTPNNATGSTTAPAPGSSISDWFRWQGRGFPSTATSDWTADMVHDPSSPPRPRNVQAAADVGQAGEEIAAAARRLANVRRLLDDVEQNMQRRRHAYGVPSSSAEAIPREPSPGTSSSRANGSDPPSREASAASNPYRPLFTGRSLSNGLPSALPTIRSSPVSAFSRVDRNVHHQNGAQTDRNALPLRTRAHRWESHTSTRPSIQPFDEIFAEVEAEFAQRDRTRSLGDRGLPSRALWRSLSRPNAGEPVPSRNPYIPAQNRQTSSESTNEMESIQNELSRLRRRLQRDWETDRPQGTSASPSGLGNGDEARARYAPNIDWEWSDVNAHTNADRHINESDRVPLPPFLLRSLRARRQATFGHGLSNIASEPANYMSDFDIDLSYEGLLTLSERLGEVMHRGASAAALANGLSKFTYVKTELGERSSCDGETRCAICLEDYAEEDPCARSNKCGHALHEACLTEWLTRNKTCPICRQIAV